MLICSNLVTLGILPNLAFRGFRATARPFKMSSHQEEIFLDIQNHLMSSLKDPTELIRFSKELYRSVVISKKVEENFASLDHNELGVDIRKKYLLQQIFIEVSNNRAVVYRLLNAFVKAGGVKSHAYLKLLVKVGKLELMLQKETPVRILQASRIPETDAVHILNVDVPVLANFLTEISHKWEILAVSLKIPKHVIEECRGSSNAVSLCNILDKWVSGSGYIPATLQCLDDVLSSKLVGECTLAGKFEKTAKFNPVLSPREPADLACFITLFINQETLK